MTQKSFHSILGLLLVASSLTIGCNATTSPTTGTTTPGSMAATLNGKAWSSAVVPGVTGGATATRSTSGIVTVTGVSTDFTEITLVLRNPGIRTDSLGLSTTALGEYSQGVPDTSTAYLSIPSLTNYFPGSITITSFDTAKKQISGQFHFVGRKSHNLSDTVLITGGSFFNVGWN